MICFLYNDSKRYNSNGQIIFSKSWSANIVMTYMGGTHSDIKVSFVLHPYIRYLVRYVSRWYMK